MEPSKQPAQCHGRPSPRYGGKYTSPVILLAGKGAKSPSASAYSYCNGLWCHCADLRPLFPFNACFWKINLMATVLYAMENCSLYKNKQK